MSSSGSPAEDSEGTSLETVLARTPSRRRQALRFATLAAVLMVVSALLLRQYQAAQTVLPPPTLTRPVVMTVIESNTTWGTLSVNGRRLPGPPPQIVTLHSADNVITLDAPPFAPVTCHVDVESSSEGGPPVAISTSVPACTSGPSNLFPSASTLGHSIIGFNLSDGGLPSEQRIAAQQAIARSLMAQELQATVPAGEYYAAGVDPQGRVIGRQASAPLSAIRDLVPPPLANEATPCGDLSCTDVSFAPGQVPAGHVWSLQEPLFMQWRFTDASGAPVGEATVGPLPSLTEFWLSQQQGAWQVTLRQNLDSGGNTVYNDQLCQVGVTELGAYTSTQAISGEIIHSEGPLGCGFIAIEALPESSKVGGFFVWRFGALLAGDAQAHQLIPALPIALPREVAEAGGP